MRCSIIKIFAILAISITACGLPKSAVHYTKTEIVKTGPGPEDLVLDTITEPLKPRLIVSCNERRKEDLTENGFYNIDIETMICTRMALKNMPASQAELRLHGIDLVMENDGQQRLYAINHNDKVGKQYILKFKVFKDYLEFEKEYWSDLITSPNDVAGYKDGSFFTTNDAKKRGSLLEPLLMLKWGSVIKGNGNDYKVFSKRYCYANGIFTTDSGLFVSTTRQNKLYFVDYVSQNKKIIGKGKGLDNITLSNNQLIVTAHLKQLKFLKHFKDSSKRSPTVVYTYDLKTGKRKCIYSDKGSEISAASTAIVYRNKLYISQVFDGFVLVKSF